MGSGTKGGAGAGAASGWGVGGPGRVGDGDKKTDKVYFSVMALLGRELVTGQQGGPAIAVNFDEL
jgi:hypothetical protein